MDSSDEEVLLESCCLFSLNLSSGANQNQKKKDEGAGNILKNRTRSLPWFIAEDACQW